MTGAQLDARVLAVSDTCVLVPDVAVEDFSEDVEDADHHRHGAEEDDSSQGRDALQHRVNPHTCHLVHPTRPEQRRLQLPSGYGTFGSTSETCEHSVPEDVSHAKAAHGRQTP